MSIVRILSDSFALLKMHPKLIIPKILVAFFFLPIIILLPIYLINFNVFSPELLSQRGSLELAGLLFQIVALLLFTLLVYFIDAFMINPMYPVLVKQCCKGEGINFRKAFVSVIERFGTIFAALVIFSVLLFASMLPFMFVLMAALLLKDDFLVNVSIVIAAISIIIMLVLFYLLYPVSSLEKGNFAKTIKWTVKTSLKHKKGVTEAVLFSLFISGLNYLFAFEMVLSNGPNQSAYTILLFILLIAARFLTAIFAAYQYVLNAVFYLGFEKGVFFSDKK